MSTRSDGSVMFDHVNGYLSPASVMDAEEYFQAKRDEELGRWRCPTETDWVAREGVRTAEGRTVVVVNERTLDRFWFNERVRDASEDVDLAHRVGRAFFEAHPERKPWEDARPGEIWEITRDGIGEGVYLRATHEWRAIWPFSGSASPASSLNRVTSARRVWPEDAS